MLLLSLCGCSQNRNESVSSADVEQTPELYLPDDERAFLWECEHRSNLLGKYGFATFAQALKNRNAEGIANCLSGDFTATTISKEPIDRTENDTVTLRRAVLADDNVKQLAKVDFTEWLLRQHGDPGSELGVSVAVLSYAPVRRDQVDESWEGRAKLRITERDADVVAEKVIEFEFSTPSFVSEAPAANWMSTWRTIQIDVGRSNKTLMREVAMERGFAPALLMDNWTCASELRSLNTGGIYLGDFNRDGRTDVFLTEPRSLQSLLLYRGIEDGRFENVTRELRLPVATGADHAAVIDLDDDGWEDIILLGLAVYRNKEGRYFEDATKLSNLDELIAQRGLEGISGATVADYDRDGLIDLYVTRGDSRDFKSGSWIDGKSGHAANNQLLRNLGAGQFEDVTAQAGANCGERSCFTSTWFDANDDGWPDIYIIHEFGAGGLLINQKDGTFKERQIATNSDDFGSMGLASGDLDNDGKIDLYVSNMYSKAGNRVMDNLSPEYYDNTTLAKLRRMVAGSQLHLNQGDGSFAATPNRTDVAAVGWGWGASLADLNNDGFLDIYATCGFMSQDRQKPDG